MPQKAQNARAVKIPALWPFFDALETHSEPNPRPVTRQTRRKKLIGRFDPNLSILVQNPKQNIKTRSKTRFCPCWASFLSQKRGIFDRKTFLCDILSEKKGRFCFFRGQQSD